MIEEQYRKIKSPSPLREQRGGSMIMAKVLECLLGITALLLQTLWNYASTIATIIKNIIFG